MTMFNLSEEKFRDALFKIAKTFQSNLIRGGWPEEKARERVDYIIAKMLISAAARDGRT